MLYYLNQILYTEDAESKFNRFVKSNPDVAQELNTNKNAIKVFLDKNPSYDVQKKISLEDIKKLITYKSKTEAKKKGLEGLVLDQDYLEFPVPEAEKAKGIQAFVPLNHKASKALANKRVCNTEAGWCVAGNNRDLWDEYINHGYFIYIIDPTKLMNHKEKVKKHEDEMYLHELDFSDLEDFERTVKIAVHYDGAENTITCYDSGDDVISASKLPFKIKFGTVKEYYKKFEELANPEQKLIRQQEEILSKVFRLEDYEYNGKYIDCHGIRVTQEFKLKSIKEFFELNPIYNLSNDKKIKIIGFGNCYADDCIIKNIPIESLEGAPKTMDDGTQLHIINTNITSLEFLPKTEFLRLENNKKLLSLKGIGKEYEFVGLEGNTALKEFDYYPKTIQELEIDAKFEDQIIKAVKDLKIEIGSINGSDASGLNEDELEDRGKGFKKEILARWDVEQLESALEDYYDAATLNKKRNESIDRYKSRLLDMAKQLYLQGININKPKNYRRG